ncbi:MAG: extracellular solute-binding protein, partial [Candidatus Limiplasma sp.]|nr:extracellular solute-binding protein [Candidatus Limiplasma sp.]
MNKRWIALLLCMTMLFSFMTVVQAEGKVEVVFWNGYTGPDQPVLEQIVNDFNASQDQVEIKMEIMPWDTLYQKLMPAMIAGNAPDVVAISVTRYSEYAMAGKLEALDSYIEKSTVITQDNLVPGLFNAGKYNGTQYALPMACAAMV